MHQSLPSSLETEMSDRLDKKIETFLNGSNIESFIRSFEVSKNVSTVSQIKQVREKLIDIPVA